MNKPIENPLGLSHLDETGQVKMVDVANKETTQRSATAQAQVRLNPKAYQLLNANDNSKGEVFNTSRIAGIQAAKRCAELIPLCHSLPLSFVGIDFYPNDTQHSITIEATCRSNYTTGVEMEAMTACSVAALTIYDMCKAADKGIVISDVQLLQKSGGKSGHWQRN